MGALFPGIYNTAIGCYRGQFVPEAFLETLEAFEISNLMIPPTGLRKVKTSSVDVESYDTDLRVLVSAGEQLTAETLAWCREQFDVEPLDAYGQTESGKMLLANYSFPDWEIKPGSMGKPLPGTEVELMDNDGELLRHPNEVGEIVVERRGPFKDYWNRPDESLQTFRGKWLRTGDLAYCDEDGYYWFVSRKDELIVSAGYRIGPKEIEATLLEHDAIEDVAVFGVPDETRGEIPKAVVSLTDSVERTNSIQKDLESFIKARVSDYQRPREVEIVDSLPRTASGKIDRDEIS
jgi:acetyl-CoA synthetase